MCVVKFKGVYWHLAQHKAEITQYTEAHILIGSYLRSIRGQTAA